MASALLSQCVGPLRVGLVGYGTIACPPGLLVSSRCYSRQVRGIKAGRWYDTASSQAFRSVGSFKT
eukprot:4451024-Amphidinium_carterae.1